MKNLPIPSRESAKDDLIKSVYKWKYKKEEKGYKPSAKEISTILSLYDEYDGGPAIVSDSLRGQGLEPKLLETIHGAYARTNYGRKLEHIRKNAFAKVPLCPICGVDVPSVLDHFLPQAEFKALSIYTRNLIPLCYTCNDVKRAQHPEAPKERFIHAYFDRLPDIQFLQADVLILDAGLTAKFSISEVEGLSPELHARLTNQIETLKLNDRYADEINLLISSHVVSLHSSYLVGGRDAVRNFLRRQAAVERERFHQNHWRPVLLSSLADHEGFCGGEFADLLPIPEEVLKELLDEFTKETQ